MRLYWTKHARDDRSAIYDYIEIDSPAAALALDEIFSFKVNYLIDHPRLGRLGRVTGTRELVIHHNYILIYDLSDESIRILRLLHVARQWPPTRN